MTYKQPEALRLARELEGVYPVNIQDQEAAAAELRRLHAENQRLRADMEAVGAGGIDPQNLNCKSNQARLATLWGYEKPHPRQPLTDQEIDRILSEAHDDTSALSVITVFARGIERAHEIGGEA